jgi:hypothetical protein
MWLGKAEPGLGVNNAFNRMPPVAQDALAATNAVGGDYSGIIGRIYYVMARYLYRDSDKRPLPPAERRATRGFACILRALRFPGPPASIPDAFRNFREQVL